MIERDISNDSNTKSYSHNKLNKRKKMSQTVSYEEESYNYSSNRIENNKQSIKNENNISNNNTIKKKNIKQIYSITSPKPSTDNINNFNNNKVTVNSPINNFNNTLIKVDESSLIEHMNSNNTQNEDNKISETQDNKNINNDTTSIDIINKIEDVKESNNIESNYIINSEEKDDKEELMTIKSKNMSKANLTENTHTAVNNNNKNNEKNYIKSKSVNNNVSLSFYWIHDKKEHEKINTTIINKEKENILKQSNKSLNFFKNTLRSNNNTIDYNCNYNNDIHSNARTLLSNKSFNTLNTITKSILKKTNSNNTIVSNSKSVNYNSKILESQKNCDSKKSHSQAKLKQNLINKNRVKTNIDSNNNSSAAFNKPSKSVSKHHQTNKLNNNTDLFDRLSQPSNSRYKYSSNNKTNTSQSKSLSKKQIKNMLGRFEVCEKNKKAHLLVEYMKQHSKENSQIRSKPSIGLMSQNIVKSKQYNAIDNDRNNIFNNTKPTINNFLNRIDYYNKKSISDKERLKKNIQEKEKQKLINQGVFIFENDEITDTNDNSISERTDINRNSLNNSNFCFYTKPKIMKLSLTELNKKAYDMINWEKRRKEKIFQKKKEKENDDLVECTFQPNIKINYNLYNEETINNSILNCDLNKSGLSPDKSWLKKANEDFNYDINKDINKVVVSNNCNNYRNNNSINYNLSGNNLKDIRNIKSLNNVLKLSNSLKVNTKQLVNRLYTPKKIKKDNKLINNNSSVGSMTKILENKTYIKYPSYIKRVNSDNIILCKKNNDTDNPSNLSNSKSMCKSIIKSSYYNNNIHKSTSFTKHNYSKNNTSSMKDTKNQEKYNDNKFQIVNDFICIIDNNKNNIDTDCKIDVKTNNIRSIEVKDKYNSNNSNFSKEKKEILKKYDSKSSFNNKYKEKEIEIRNDYLSFGGNGNNIDKDDYAIINNKDNNISNSNYDNRYENNKKTFDFLLKLSNQSLLNKTNAN